MPTADLPEPGEPGARLPVEGTLNFRDLGGYRTATGRTVARGQVFRSDHLNELTDDGVAAFDALGIRTVVDLRFADERAAQPSRLPDGVAVIQARPDGTEMANQIGIMDKILSGEITSYTGEDFGNDYRRMISDGAEIVTSVLHAVADDTNGPVLFHCTAGKDRTGIAAAAILRVLNVPDETIEFDYLLTNPYRTATRLAQMRPVLANQGIDIENVRALFEAPVVALRAALDTIDAGGGVEPFFIERGLDPDAPAAIRARLLS